MTDGFKLGTAAAEMLLRVRIALACQGGMQSRDGSVVAVLPGPEFSLGLLPGNRAQMHYTSGRPLSAKLDLTDPGQFMSLMHNVDVCIFGSDEIPPLDPRRCRAPASLAAFADAYAYAVLEGDAELARLVPTGDLDHPEQGDGWAIGPLAVAMAQAGTLSGDPVLADAAGTFLRESSAGSSPAFSSRESLIRWGAQVEAWLAPEPEAFEALDGHAWTEVTSEGGVTAAARSLGWLEGELSTGPAAEVERDGKSLAERLREILDGDGWPRFGADGTRVFTLAGPDGGLVAAATVEGDEVAVRGPKGSEVGYDEHAEVLRSVLGLGDAGPRM